MSRTSRKREDEVCRMMKRQKGCGGEGRVRRRVEDMRENRQAGGRCGIVKMRWQDRGQGKGDEAGGVGGVQEIGNRANR